MRHGLTGWVKNREDGAVVALLHGREDRIRDIIRWAKSGPPGAVVRDVLSEEVREYRPSQNGFAIIY